MKTGKGGNPLNELELISESLMNNGGVLRGNNVIRYVPEDAVVGLGYGDRIELSAKEFEDLSGAVFEDLRERFL